MPSLLGTTVTANYLKTKPTTQFGTRALRIIKIVASNGGSSNIDFTRQVYGVTGASSGAFTGTYNDSASYYSLAVRAIQTAAEIYAIGQPDTTSFIAVISYDTNNDSDTGSNVPGGWGDMEAAIQDAVRSQLGSGTVSGSVGTLADTAIVVTAIDVAGGAQNFVGGAIGTLA